MVSVGSSVKFRWRFCQPQQGLIDCAGAMLRSLHEIVPSSEKQWVYAASGHAEATASWWLGCTLAAVPHGTVCFKAALLTAAHSFHQHAVAALYCCLSCRICLPQLLPASIGSPPGRWRGDSRDKQARSSSGGSRGSGGDRSSAISIKIKTCRRDMKMRQKGLMQTRMPSAAAAAARSIAPGTAAERSRVGARSERSSVAVAERGGCLLKTTLMRSSCADGHHAADGKQQQRVLSIFSVGLFVKLSCKVQHSMGLACSSNDSRRVNGTTQQWRRSFSLG
jgi:hypothetical protein